MKKLFTVLFFTACALSARSQVRVYYEIQDTLFDFEQALLRFDDMSYMGVRIDPPGDGEHIMTVTRVECNNGGSESEEVMRFPFRGPHTLHFFAREGNGEVKLGVNSKSARHTHTVSMPEEGKLTRIFIETYPDGYIAGTGNSNGKFFYSDSEEIPVVAYSTGIKMQMNYMGETTEFFNFCALRDKALHPSEWYGEGIGEYVYYTVKITPAE